MMTTRSARFGALVLACASGVALWIAACSDSPSSTHATEASVTTGQQPAGSSLLQQPFDQSSREQILAAARATTFDLRYGTGDQQRLMVGKCPEACRHGPLADIQPAKGAHSATEAELAAGRFVGRMINHDNEEYPKLNLGSRDTTYVWVDKSGGTWRAVLVPASATRTSVEKGMTLELHPEGEAWVQSAARWVWSDLDEEAWFSCTTWGCCTIDP